MDDVGDEVDVALTAAAPGVDAERLLHGKTQEQQLDVVHVELVRGLPLARALLQVRVVSEKQQGSVPELLLLQHGPAAQQGRHRKALKNKQGSTKAAPATLDSPPQREALSSLWQIQIHLQISVHSSILFSHAQDLGYNAQAEMLPGCYHS